MLLFICLICLLVYNIFIYIVARSLVRSINAIWNENRERARHTAPIAQCVTIYCKINCSIQNAITTPEERRRRAMCTIYEYYSYIVLIIIAMNTVVGASVCAVHRTHRTRAIASNLCVRFCSKNIIKARENAHTYSHTVDAHIVYQ